MQQHLMQMQPMMAPYDPNDVTTDIIQQYLDENKQLILHILDCQSAGKLGECAENQARLQRNLMYLAAVADCQPSLSAFHPQSTPNATMQLGTRHLQNQHVHQMSPQSYMAARSSMLYGQQPLSALQQQASLNGQLGMIPGGNSGIYIQHGDGGLVGSVEVLASRGFTDLGNSSGESLQAAWNRGAMGSAKLEVENAGSTEGRATSGTGLNNYGMESLYSTSSAEDAN